ncbi:hypothetical protein JHK87_042971 [Glycine soja]|nr:hypothetical protein JHK87_042971 [Glycine soja]
MNLTGEGKFGEVYKGLLQHGILVAIKKCRGLASQEFVHEVIRMNNVPIASDEFQVGSNGMLDDWEENLAVITANKTKVVDENFESYSDSARLCLIGADHWKFLELMLVQMLSRYVDTFNQGGGTSTNLFQSPSIPSVKPALAANAKSFVPTAAPSSNEQTMEAIVEIKQEDNILGSNSAYGAYGSYSLGRSSTGG